MNYQEIFDKLDKYIQDNNYSGPDPCQINATPFYMWLQAINHDYKLGKYVYFPFKQLNKYFPKTLRWIVRPKDVCSEQTFAFVNQTKNKALLTSSPHGQPYNWYSGKVIPANTIRSTVTAEIGLALLSRNNEVCNSVAKVNGNFFLDMNYYTSPDGDICFPYTTLGGYGIHNANLLVASFLCKLSHVTGEKKYHEIGMKAYQYSVKHQNKDGSWNYNGHRIDSYHTGMVLEALLELKKLDPDKFPFEIELLNGMYFYISEFFTYDYVPKITPDKIHPIDIASCAQAIIVLSMHGYILHRDLVAKWTIDNMWSGEYFYYRKYKYWTDKSSYIRWNQAWMLKALSYLIK